MKKLVMVIMVLCLMSGCNEEMQAKLGELVTTVGALNQQVEIYQEASKEIVDSLVVAEVIDKEHADKFDAINKEIDKVQAHTTVLAEAVKDAGVSDDPTLAIVQTLQAANAASAPFNPYAIPAGAALTVIGTILALIRENGKKKAANSELRLQYDRNFVTENNLRKVETERQDLEAKYKAANQGMEKYRLDNPVEGPKLYEAVGDARVRVGVTI